MKNKVLKINIFTFLLLFILLLALEIDYITYFFNAKYMISFFISFIFNIIISYFLLKKIEIVNTLEKSDIIFFAFLVLVFIITIVYPDRSFDTINYHLYLQENPFGNKIGYDFFAGKNLNSFSYAFPDRVFYIFRHFLGYRLGVILNYLLLVIVYTQVKEINKKVIPKINSLALTIISTLTVITVSLIDIVDSYYVDLLSLVLLLEILRLVINEKINKENSTILLGYLALLFGFSLATKISNLPILGFLFILYIIRNKNIIRCLNKKNILITLLLLIAPICIYFTYTLVETGNPIFPFYNTIFKSKYFSNRNWLDTRFGPRRLLEVPIYPWIALNNPIRSCDIGIFEPIWCYGYFIAIIYTCYLLYIKYIKKLKIDTNKLFLVITTIVMYLLWSKFQLGYTRYGFITLILGSICFYLLIYDSVKKKQYMILAIMCILTVYNLGYSINNYIYQKKEWIYNNYYNNNCTYKDNLKNIFAYGNDNKLKLEKNSVWGIIYENSGQAQMINNDIRIVNIGQSSDNKYTRKLLDNRLANAKHIYSLTDTIDFDNFINSLNDYGYKITNIKDVLRSNILCSNNMKIYIFEIEKGKNIKTHMDSFEDDIIYDLSQNNISNIYLGTYKFSSIYDHDLKALIIGIKDNEEHIIDTITIPKDGNMVNLKYDLTGYDTIKIKSLDKENLMAIYETK